MHGFEGKTVLVTGGSRGIGRQLALDFADAGANIAINYARSDAAAEEVADRVRASGAAALCCKGDLASSADVMAVVAATLNAFGRIDILVNNAGINADASFLEMTEADWDRVLDVNLKGPFLISQAVGRAMWSVEQGCIVNISAVTGVDARKNAANFCVSKAGLNMLTRCMALELAPFVQVNSLALGFIRSDLVEEVFTRDQIDGVIGDTPLQRMGEIAEISATVRFLASPSAAFITGQTLIVDGGRVMR